MQHRRPLARLAHALAGVAVLLATTSASAADRAPLSSLPVLRAAHEAKDPPKKYGVPGLTVKESPGYGGSTYTEIFAAKAQGYCIANKELGLQLTVSSSGVENELWRLTEADGKVTLEQTRFELASYLKSAWVKGRTSIELREVAKTKAVTVWSYREPNGDVMLIARGADSGRESHRVKKTEEDAPILGFVSISGCSFGATRIHASAIRSGAAAQLRGSLPPVGEGKQKVVPQFLVDGSIAKVARDPEPVLAVRIRVVEDGASL